MLGIRIILFASLYLVSTFAFTNTLSDIKSINSNKVSTVKIPFNSNLMYSLFLPLNNSHIIALNARYSRVIEGLPFILDKKKIINNNHPNHFQNNIHISLIFELSQSIKNISFKNLQNEPSYINLNTYKKHHIKSSHHKSYDKPIASIYRHNKHSSCCLNKKRSFTTKHTIKKFSKAKNKEHQIIVAIDAGHGGQDPGASNNTGLYEKNITMKIARNLKKLMDNDPMFKPFLTRNGDYFISVMGRSEIARKKKANLLVSIHVDSSPNHLAKGASVWILSKSRANSEMANWLKKKKEQQSELLGGIGSILLKNKQDPYFTQTILDLQFCYSHHVGYDIALNVIKQLDEITPLHKRLPTCASLGILRAPDIPSILVETGFISNSKEAHLLNNSEYQYKIAESIYMGLRNYFLKHSIA